MKNSRKASGVMLVSLVIAVFILTGMADAKQMVLKFGHAGNKTISLPGYQATNAYQLGAEKIKEIVEAKSNGAIKIDIYPAGQIGAERELLEALKLGLVDLSVTASAPLSAWEPTTMVTDLPFIFKDIESARRLLAGELGQELMGKLEKHGIKGLSLADNTFRHMVTRKAPVKNPEDIKGLKFRVMESPLFIEMFKALGASATPIPWTEVYTALQTGVVDGYEIPITFHLSSKCYEVAKYYSFTNHILTVTPYLMSLKTWNKLSPDMQKVFIEAGLAARQVHNKQTDDINRVAVENLKKAGTVFTESNVSAFSEKMGGVYQKFEKEIGKDLIDRFKNFK